MTPSVTYSIYLASTNKNKKNLFRQYFNEVHWIKLHFQDFFKNIPLVDESASTYAGNALLKAKNLLPFLDKDSWALADDTGLEVEALQGAPGVRSKRFSDIGKDQSNRDKLLKCMENFIGEQRRARFVTILALVNQQEEHFFSGVCEGQIPLEPQGEGFGYTSVFIPDGHTQSLAQMDLAAKHELHRSLAVNALIKFLEKRKV